MKKEKIVELSKLSVYVLFLAGFVVLGIMIFNLPKPVEPVEKICPTCKVCAEPICAQPPLQRPCDIKPLPIEVR